MWGEFLSPELIQKYNIDMPQTSAPANNPRYDKFNNQSLVNDYKGGVLDSIVTAPLSVIGLEDKDYPYVRADIKIKDGVATLDEDWSLDDPKGDKKGDEKARSLGEFVVERYNEIAMANGTYGKPGKNYTLTVGSASGRGGGSKLGKGFFVGHGGSFKSGSTYTNLETIQDLAKSVDRYIADSSGFDFEKLPEWGDQTFQPQQIGKIDNTNKFAKLASAIAISYLGGQAFSALTNAGGGAASAGTGGMNLAGSSSTQFLASPAASAGWTGGVGGGVAGATVPSFVGTTAGIGAGGTLTAAATGGNGIINNAINATKNFAIDHPNATYSLTNKAIDTGKGLISGGMSAEEKALIEQGRMAEAKVLSDKRAIADNTSVESTNLGVKSSGKVLTDSQGNPIYTPDGGLISRAIAA